ncbi:hypothetical protein CONLIGDRAFT_497136 [Coniochaeta ligniaria NRRL 30616]|uniref:Uncharacterized protein n=1 Tax=Coniochaeta ligniaria NRRL 30616 TaxID=1408157 RepID=A0A1J7IWZ6_9PEZI|nr:hypothetical protein CONLIGDRAFT_497136 [Coniochaeta ligniaria NRRL 30616]
MVDALRRVVGVGMLLLNDYAYFPCPHGCAGREIRRWSLDERIELVVLWVSNGNPPRGTGKTAERRVPSDSDKSQSSTSSTAHDAILSPSKADTESLDGVDEDEGSGDRGWLWTWTRGEQFQSHDEIPSHRTGVWQTPETASISGRPSCLNLHSGRRP